MTTDPVSGLSRRDRSLLYGDDGQLRHVFEPWVAASIEEWTIRGSEPKTSPIWVPERKIHPTISRLLAAWIPLGYDQVNLGDGAGYRTIIAALNVVDDVQRSGTVRIISRGHV